MQINTDNRVPQNMDHCPRGSQLFVMGLVSGSVSTHSATLAASGVKRNCVKQLCKSILVEKHNINVHFNESHQFQLSDFFRKIYSQIRRSVMVSVFAKDLDVNPLVSCDLSVWSLDFLPVSVWVLTSYSSFGPKSKHTDRLGQMAITSRSAG